MSTHSETILNNAFPDEIIITEFKDGATFAKRCANADDILYFKVNANQKNFEGTGGKSQIKQIINPKNYSETQDGPELAKLCDITTVSKNSKSFRSFFDKLSKMRCVLTNIE